jgi:hypothetical protein
VAGSSLSYCHLSLGGPIVLVALEDVSCVCSFSVYHCVSLLSFPAFLEGYTAMSLCTCVESLACFCLVVSLVKFLMLYL